MPERPFYHIEAPEPWVCRVCQVPLTQLEDGTWTHGRIAAVREHTPEPVPPGTVEAVPICDFCSRHGVAWVFPATAFDMSAMPWGSADDWAACDECKQLIEADDVPALVQHMVRTNPETRALHPVLAGYATTELVNKFMAHRMGPPTPYRD